MAQSSTKGVNNSHFSLWRDSAVWIFAWQASLFLLNMTIVLDTAFDAIRVVTYTNSTTYGFMYDATRFE